MRFRRGQRGPAERWGTDPRAELLVAEVEDFLAGRSALRLARAGDTVAPWAVVNALAHAEPSELRVVADDGLARHPSAPTAALARLAGLVVAHRADHEIRTVQRALLVPLELGVLRTARSAELTTAQVEAVVVAMLRQWRGRDGAPA